jgi:hypothetical protein
VGLEEKVSLVSTHSTVSMAGGVRRSSSFTAGMEAYLDSDNDDYDDDCDGDKENQSTISPEMLAGGWRVFHRDEEEEEVQAEATRADDDDDEYQDDEYESEEENNTGTTQESNKANTPGTAMDAVVRQHRTQYMTTATIDDDDDDDGYSIQESPVLMNSMNASYDSSVQSSILEDDDLVRIVHSPHLTGRCSEVPSMASVGTSGSMVLEGVAVKSLSSFQVSEEEEEDYDDSFGEEGEEEEEEEEYGDDSFDAVDVDGGESVFEIASALAALKTLAEGEYEEVLGLLRN